MDNIQGIKKEYRTFGNPYLPLWEHLPDGEPRVFEDPDNPGNYRVYVIGSHDVRFDSYCGPDIRVWSAAVEDLTLWRDEGSVFTYKSDGLWDVMYAPDLVEIKHKDGSKDYYLYPHSRGPDREAMVAKGDSPTGPFTPVNLNPDGKSVTDGSVMGFDPAVFIEYITDENEPDFDLGFRAYGFWGFQRIYAAELNASTMYSVRHGTEIIECFIPSSFEYGKIRDPKGTVYPHIYEGEDLSTFNFFEAASIRKIGNKYVWVYSGFSGPDYGLSSTNSALRYAFGDTPLGPWRGGGVLVDSRAVVLNRYGTALETSYSGHNTHGSIELINGQWYVFYHRAPRGFGYARQPMVAPVNIKWDEKPVSEGGRVEIRAWDAYTEDNIKYTKAGDNEYKGAEVTSEGFSVYGLEPYRYYSAGIACYLSNTASQSDSWDIWDNHAPINDVKNNDIIGYKYFDFRDKEEDTALNLFITPKSLRAFKINVWLNGPWDNDVWNGIKIGEIKIPSGSENVITHFTLDMGTVLDKLNRKHAVFLVAEGADTDILFDLIGLGFSSSNHKIKRAAAPTVSINANGIEIQLPAEPIRSDDTNGITGYNFFKATTTLSDDGTVPVITASASDADVGITIKQAVGTDDSAVVEFIYRGAKKIYRIFFSG
ncbi:MAG: hypothetical protein FWG70_03650 [Oscillospiraceae bacterium]|nr:hypothetical protein [Oscillospiraceae bacterium]